MSYAKSQFTNKLAHHKDEQYCMDATPITLFDSTFLMHCYNFNPSAKFIVLLRDPVERAYSHYQMSKSRGEENRSFLSALLQEKKRLREADKDWAFSSSLRVHSYLSRGCYAQQLVQLYRIVPAKQVLVLTSSELKNQHANTLQKVNRFLEIEDCHTPAKLVFETSTPRLSLYERVSDVLGRLYARWYFIKRKETPARWHAIVENENARTDA